MLELSPEWIRFKKLPFVLLLCGIKVVAPEGKKTELFLQNENIVGVFDQASHLSTLRPVCLSTRIGQMNILNT